jgi:putative transposase
MSQTLSRAHTRYNIRYHFVWIVKYRKDLLFRDNLATTVKETIKAICERYEFDLDTMATDGNHIHIFLGAFPRYSPAKIVEIIKTISAKQIFQLHPEVKKELWGGEFWGDGYYVRTVGHEVTDDIIREYINNQGRENQHKDFNQLRLW